VGWKCYETPRTRKLVEPIKCSSFRTPKAFGTFLGSGLVDQSQKITVSARAVAERKTIGHLS
jgi:hypothetical protein